MAMVRKTHDAQFKIKVALEAIKQQKTLNELTAEYGVHATQLIPGKGKRLQRFLKRFPANAIENRKISKVKSTNFTVK